MPELPEVETIRAGLARTVLGARIAEVEVLRDRSIRRQVGGEDALLDGLVGKHLLAAARRGKFLWLPLGATRDTAPHTALLVHLGMSGQLLVRREHASQPHRHLRVRLHLSDAQSGVRALDFVDQRTFGHLLVDPLVAPADAAPPDQPPDADAPPPDQLPELVPRSAQHIARDLLDPRFDLDAVVAKLRTRRTGIKRALLDQQVVSGIGNIYADEALWQAGVHFARATDRLTSTQLEQVLQAAAEVMSRSLAQGGTSFDALYVDVAGESGYFSRSLAVYGREGQPCPRCGTPVSRAAFMNRSAHYCAKCQPAPRGRNGRL